MRAARARNVRQGRPPAAAWRGSHSRSPWRSHPPRCGRAQPAREDRGRRRRHGTTRTQGNDGRRRGLRLGNDKARRNCSDQGLSLLDGLGGQAFRRPCPAFVEQDQPDRDACAMLGIEVPEDGDLDTRVYCFADHRIAGGGGAVRCEARWHDRDAAPARCQTQQRGTQMTGARETVLAASLAPAEGRVHQHDTWRLAGR